MKFGVMMNDATLEDKREAVNIGISLSNQLITISLALIAVVGAVATFIMQQREVHFWFYFCLALSFFSLLASIFCGGKGINKVRNKGFNGEWTTTEGKKCFDWQAKLTFVGVISFCFLFFTSIDKESTLEKSQSETNKLLNEQINQTNQLLQKITKDQEERLLQINLKINSLEDSFKEKQALKQKEKMITKTPADNK